jgi:hypothetical protein
VEEQQASRSFPLGGIRLLEQRRNSRAVDVRIRTQTQLAYKY